MRRASFIGALVSLTIGAVLAFGVNASWRCFDVRTAGFVVMLGALADLVIRILIADSPLLSPQSAEVAAVVEPLGEPLLDADGNPLIVANPAAATGPAHFASPGAARPEDPASEAAQARRVRTVLGRIDRDAFAQPPGVPQAPPAVMTILGRPVRPRRRAADRPVNHR
ncbi:MAG TPA: hypothetical protein VL551_25415 [Actinospica sp.]|jgi:hypothetical protein|nr:hypothetical protein [Actinospica sp.]